MAKTFKVWVEIEQYDNKTDCSTTLDAPGASLREFKSYKRAWDFAQRITDIANDLNESEG